MRRKRNKNDDIMIKSSSLKQSNVMKKPLHNGKNNNQNQYNTIMNLQETVGNQVVQQMIMSKENPLMGGSNLVQREGTGTRREAKERQMLFKAIVNALKNIVGFPSESQTAIRFANSILSGSNLLSLPSNLFLNVRIDISTFTELVKEMQRDIDISISPSEAINKINYYMHGVFGLPY